MSIIVIGLVQVWSGFQTISTLSPNRTKLKRGDVYLNFSPYSSSCPIPVAPQAHTLEDTYERQRRARDAGAGRPCPGQPRRRAGSARTRVAVPLPRFHQGAGLAGPWRVRAGIRVHAMPVARWSRRTAPRMRRTWSDTSPMAACRAGAVRPQGALGEGGDLIPGARRLSGEPGGVPATTGVDGTQKYRPGVDGVSNTVQPCTVLAVGSDTFGPDRARTR